MVAGISLIDSWEQRGAPATPKERSRLVDAFEELKYEPEASKTSGTIKALIAAIAIAALVAGGD